MIFHRCDADAKQFMYLAVTEFVHPVHQEDTPRLWRHGVNGGFVQSQQVRGFEVPFLRRRRGAVALLAKRKESRPRGLLASRSVNQDVRSEEHTSELQSLMRISYAVFCLKNKQENTTYVISREKHYNKTCDKYQ